MSERLDQAVALRDKVIDLAREHGYQVEALTLLYDGRVTQYRVEFTPRQTSYTVTGT